MSEGYQVKVRPEKVEEVGRIRAELDEASAAVVTEYRGLTVEALKVLRSRLLEHDTTYRVTKNTLARRAAAELGLEALEEMLVGPVAVAYIKGDPIAASKIIATFAREHPELLIKGGVLDGVVLDDVQAKGLATIDSLEVSLAKIMGLLTAPLQQLMMLLQAPAQRILYVLEELGKREGGEAPAEAPAEAASEAEAPAETPEAPAQPEPQAEAAPAGEGEAAAGESEKPAEPPTQDETPAEPPAEEEAPEQEETSEEGE